MTIIDSTFNNIILGPATTFQNLTVFPLMGASDQEPSYDTLDAALIRETVRVTEVSESGHVPEIKVLNRGARPVLIIDGEELVGAKQNRTVNLSILVPAQADVVVPVTCVEAGRWHSRSRHFASASRTHFAEGRAAKSRQVSESLLARGMPEADQGQVWNAIAAKSARFRTRSATGAMADIFDAQAATVEDYVRAIPTSAGQLGAVFVVGGEPKGIDLFDSSRTLRALLPKVLRGYALDAIDWRSDRDDTLPDGPSRSHSASSNGDARVQQFLNDAISSDRKSFEAIGLGQSWRLMGSRVSGGALTADDTLVHLSAFAA